MKTKICSKCRIEKYINKFHIDKHTKDNYSSWCKLCRKIYDKIYYKKRYKKYRIRIIKQKYREKHKKEIKKLGNEWRKKHRNYSSIYQKERRKKDLNFKLAGNLRKRITNALKNNYKTITTSELLGCSIPKLKNHLEKQFKPRMTWKNYGFYGWHIDHIKGCCNFDLRKKSEQLKCFNYKNLQPLWAKENLSKVKK